MFRCNTISAFEVISVVFFFFFASSESINLKTKSGTKTTKKNVPYLENDTFLP